MDVQTNNMAPQFTTKLSEPIKLKGSWEVGLLEVTFPGKAVNVFSDRFHYELQLKDNQRIKCILNPGVYNSITMLFVEMRLYLMAVDDKEAKQPIEFNYMCHAHPTHTYEVMSLRTSSQ